MASTTHAGGWQLEKDSAEAYEQYLVPVFFRPWAQDLAALAGVRQGDRVLDVACGTGIVARTAAGLVGPRGSVTGLDLNEGMLAAARRFARDASPAIQWKQGDAARMPLPDAAFDAVLCQQALQFFPDRAAALREMARVLAPGGRLAVAVLRGLEHHGPYAALAAALEAHAAPEAGAMVRSIFPAIEAADLKALAEGAGLRGARVRIGITAARYPSASEMLRREAASSPLAGPIGALSADRREGLLRDAAARLGPWTDDEGVAFPMATWLLTATR